MTTEAITKSESKIAQAREEEEAVLQPEHVGLEWKKSYEELVKQGKDPFQADPYPFSAPDTEDNITWMEVSYHTSYSINYSGWKATYYCSYNKTSC